VKRLTESQLRELEVRNLSEFGAPFWMTYYAYGHACSRHGWYLDFLGEPVGYQGKQRLHLGWIDRPNRLKPEDLRKEAEPRLKERGLTWPDEWERVLGSLVPRGFYEARMAELSSQYKAKKAADSAPLQAERQEEK